MLSRAADGESARGDADIPAATAARNAVTRRLQNAQPTSWRHDAVPTMFTVLTTTQSRRDITFSIEAADIAFKSTLTSKSNTPTPKVLYSYAIASFMIKTFESKRRMVSSAATPDEGEATMICFGRGVHATMASCRSFRAWVFARTYFLSSPSIYYAAFAYMVTHAASSQYASWPCRMLLFYFAARRISRLRYDIRFSASRARSKHARTRT